MGICGCSGTPDDLGRETTGTLLDGHCLWSYLRSKLHSIILLVHQGTDNPPVKAGIDLFKERTAR